MITSSYFILYVRDQPKSALFYEKVLGISPRINVPGMTEFALGEHTVLGIMPLTGISRLLSVSVPQNPDRLLPAEIYLLVEDPQAYHLRAIAAGAREISGLAPRDWGHQVAYSMDPDGYIIAFAKPIAKADDSPPN